jgi:RNA polymerase sigma-70 factor (ECF subfamily)
MINTDLEFQKVFDEFQPKILRYLARMVGDTEAEDLTQEVFVKVDRALGTFRGEASLSTWIYRIATNTAMDRLRSPALRLSACQCSVSTSGEDSDAELEDCNAWTGEKIPPIEHQIYRDEMNQCIQGFIRKLPEDYRLVLLLSEFEGLRNHAIAEILNISLETAKIRLHRARELLKEELAANCDSYWIEGNEFVPELKTV